MDEQSIKQPVPPLTAASTCSRVLVVEDEALIRRQIVKALESLGVVVHATATVADAQSVLASEPIELLITDGRLADGSGRALADAARLARPGIRVLLVSGSIDSSEAFDATLAKPFTSQHLLEAARQLLHRDP